MTAEDIEFLNTIQEYADKVMPDIDPQKVQISEQLQKLRPIIQELAMKHKMSVEDTFIRYMDLATERAVNYENKMNDEFEGTFSKPQMPKY